MGSEHIFIRSGGQEVKSHFGRRVISDAGQQGRGKVRDESKRGLMRHGFVFFFVREKPVSVVVALQAGEETEEVWGEVRGHEIQVKGLGPGK
jgi:hypothetical protein